MKTKNFKKLVFIATVLIFIGIASAEANTTSKHIENPGKHYNDSTSDGGIFLSIIYLIGISAGLALIAYSLLVWRNTKGSQIGLTARYVFAGALTFTIAFTGFLLKQTVGFNIWYFIKNEKVYEMWQVWLFTATLVFYTLGYKKLVNQTIEGGNR